jgi:beta-lactamase regulating signal transducer with metallopeptidase domain
MQTALEILPANALVALVIACAAVLAGRVCHRPAVAHFLWVLVLLKLITPPLFRVPWPEFVSPPLEVTAEAALPLTPEMERLLKQESNAGRAVPAAEIIPSLDRAAAESAAGDFRNRLKALATPAGLWVAGSFFAAGWILVRIVRFHRILQRTALPDDAVQETVEKLAASAGMKRPPKVKVVGASVSPMLWMPGGGGTIVLPRGLRNELSQEELEAVLAHEISHLARGDHWVRWIELLATVFYWWCPVLWWARWELRRHEEICCDFHVMVCFPEQSPVYARALVRTVGFLAGNTLHLPPAACGAGQVKSLKQRIAMMHQHSPHAALTLCARRWLMVLSLVPLGLSPAKEDRRNTWMQELQTAFDSLSPCIVDIDRDGLPDIVLVCYQSDTLSIYRNLGGSARSKECFARRVDFPTGPNPASLAAGDLDGDGRPDLVVANDYGACVSVYRNTSVSGHIDSASLAPRVNLAAGRHPVSVQLCDFDGDGRRDIAVANAVHGPSTVSIHRNRTRPGVIDESSFEAGVHFASGEYTFHIEAGDVTGDGKPDVVASNVEGKGLAVLRNRCQAGAPLNSTSLDAPLLLPTGWRTHGNALGDLDGDSRPELIALHDNGITVFGNDAFPQGPFDASVFPMRAAAGQSPWTTTGGTAYEGAFADMDHDGREELIVTVRGLDGVCVFPPGTAPGDGPLSRGRLLPGKGLGLAVGDLDGDRTPEVVTCLNFVLRVRGSDF